jgi:hypothetical protein
MTRLNIIIIILITNLAYVTCHAIEELLKGILLMGAELTVPYFYIFLYLSFTLQLNDYNHNYGLKFSAKF